jgi:ATP-dependent Lon protease
MANIGTHMEHKYTDSTMDEVKPTRLDAKILEYLSDRVILKPLTRWNEAYKEFPRYVMEYLCSRFVDPKEPLPGQQKIDRILEEHYVESGKKELIKSHIREQGEYTFLGQLALSYDQRSDHYWADVPALGDSHVRVSERVKREFGDILLTTGAWGTMRVEFDGTYELKGKKYPFNIAEFTPFQVIRLSLDDYVEKRKFFTTQEWIDLLIQTIGYNPYRLDERVKQLLLLRLVPFVESNYNLVELGPRETGKTYMYKNTSPRAFVVSSGKSTPATLFYHKARKRVGIIGVKDVVVFDEVAREGEGEPKFDAETIDTLKMFMQSGQYTRDNIEFTSSCSVVLGGNISADTEKRTPVEGYRHLFEPLPAELRNDTAFLDRLHAYLPGWEVPKIAPENYATGYGFISDYLAEIFRLLRRRNFQTHMTARIVFQGMTGRNQDAVQKTSAGLLKLIYPHRSPDDIEPDELMFCLDLAVEMRRRITDQLRVIAPKEFAHAKFAFHANGQ